MSKRNSVPGPFFRSLPSTIRTSLPRLVLIATAAGALVVIGGSSYVISRATSTPPEHTLKPHTRPSTATPATQAEVLGDSTSSTSQKTDTSASTPTATATSQASTPPNPPSSPTPAAPSSTRVNVSTRPKKTEVHVDTPVGSLVLNLPLGL